MGNRVLHDLSLLNELKQWHSVDDVVVGGNSHSSLSEGETGSIVFSGTICCDRAGGYASIRSATNLFDLSRYPGIAIKVKGDARRYKLSLRCATDFEGIAYRVAFQTRKEVEQTIRFRWDTFVPTYQDRVLATAPPLDPSEIRSVGLVVSSQESGSFRLEILHIDVNDKRLM
ncbi:CIA30 family protein [Malonomonas rubra]|uniref:CIA30 family protein n=1 Tax=Malonomonas rubra TaxID=57040 RepID=UPI0026EB5CBF|nr:CIA30 family protein [Malonomonas rubra]